MAKLAAIGEPEKCRVCGNDYNPLDQSTHPPTCSKNHWWIWISATIHAGSPCWISQEVDCGTKGVWFCDTCPVFKIEEAKKNRKEERYYESY